MNYSAVIIKFRDVPDVINRIKHSRAFQTRFFRAGDKEGEEAALLRLYADARKSGFTRNEVIEVRRRTIEIPHELAEMKAMIAEGKISIT